MGKVTIYLADSLEERVREAGVSMSPICQQALEKEVEKVEAMAKATSDMERVAARLQATVSDEYVKEREDGRQRGVEWAREVASLRELEELCDLAHEPHWLVVRLDEDHSIRAFLEWGDAGGLDVDRSPFIEGFIEGAESVHEAVLPLMWDDRKES